MDACGDRGGLGVPALLHGRTASRSAPVPV